MASTHALSSARASRTRRKNRNRNAKIAALMAENEQLRRDRLVLARLALPEHPKGGFFNPIVAWEARALAERVLTETPRG